MDSPTADRGKGRLLHRVGVSGEAEVGEGAGSSCQRIHQPLRRRPPSGKRVGVRTSIGEGRWGGAGTGLWILYNSGRELYMVVNAGRPFDTYFMSDRATRHVRPRLTDALQQAF